MGKFIYFLFKNSPTVLFVTLGMTGWFQTIKDKHNHIEFIFNNDILYFNDIRNLEQL